MMHRGDVVTVALPGDYGKPRPALIVQSDLFDDHPSVTILPISSELRDTPLFRIAVPADNSTGLRRASQIMIDKIQTLPRAKLGQQIGRLDDTRMLAVTRALALFLGFA